MGKKKRQIGSFSEYCEKRKLEKIKESNHVAIEVPFWDEAIDSTMSCLKSNGILSYKDLVDYVKKKFVILDREETDETTMIKAHISDLLFQQYGDTFLTGDTDGGTSYDLEATSAKALVISQLADAIYRKVLKETGQVVVEEPEDPKTVATVSLDLCPFDYEEYLGEMRVAGFEKFVKMKKKKNELKKK